MNIDTNRNRGIVLECCWTGKGFHLDVQKTEEMAQAIADTFRALEDELSALRRTADVATGSLIALTAVESLRICSDFRAKSIKASVPRTRHRPHRARSQVAAFDMRRRGVPGRC